VQNLIRLFLNSVLTLFLRQIFQSTRVPQLLTFPLVNVGTEFENQIVVDVENQGELSFYNLDGESFANSMQFDLAYELFDRFDVKMAYKINDVKSTYDGEIKEDKIAIDYDKTFTLNQVDNTGLQIKPPAIDQSNL